MTEIKPQEIYLKDYQVPDFLIEKTDLVFAIEEAQVTVTSTLLVARNPDSSNTETPLVLHGQALDLVSVSIDGRELAPEEFQVDDETMTLTVANRCIVTCVTRIQPQNNTSLEGLYKSNGMYCTQCEAEGFRKITYYLDRPDVMSEFRTKIIADKTRYPVLLSNGNLLDQGELDNNRHWAQWHDPFKKPAYLFALVAGELKYIEDQFTTMSQREVILRIYVEEKDLDKCDHAMTSLKNAMKWDEEVYGREYDLDIFMIVAVDDFNMGAMENKGLNIFNTSCVLAKPETTTDVGFQRVEAVVAHEYFHNWSGNRVTCRDWFQLSLKEGFTVFRDAEFSADMGSAAVKRIEDVTLLRTMQFAEDAGPMSHPVQPPSFIEISNFYTLTIYEKGAEVVRMIHTLLGAETFREGSELYFQRHDGQAVTIGDFVAAMETVSGRDLTQFKRWYTQAGTPIVTINEQYDEQKQQYFLTLEQHCPDTPEATSGNKKPFHIPVAMGLVGSSSQGYLPFSYGDNDRIEQTVLELTESKQAFVFEQVIERPVVSIFRDFSAPVRIKIQRSREEYLQLLAYDTDSFSRWDAAQQLAVETMMDIVAAYQNNQHDNMAIDPSLLQGLRVAIADKSIDPAVLSLLCTLPSEAYLIEISHTANVDAIVYAHRKLDEFLAAGLVDEFAAIYKSLDVPEPYQAVSKSVAKRSLKNIALRYLVLANHQQHVSWCQQQFESADNMTDVFSALKLLVHYVGGDIAQKALDDFYEKWQHESLVVNQWLSVQSSAPRISALKTVHELMGHPGFSITNPNKVRSLLGAFAQNTLAFHQESGDGYRFLMERIIQLNTLNPQIAARAIIPLTRWKNFDDKRQSLMKECLQKIYDTPKLSKDVFEVVSKSLQ